MLDFVTFGAALELPCKRCPAKGRYLLCRARHMHRSLRFVVPCIRSSDMRLLSRVQSVFAILCVASSRYILGAAQGAEPLTEDAVPLLQSRPSDNVAHGAHAPHNMWKVPVFSTCPRVPPPSPACGGVAILLTSHRQLTEVGMYLDMLARCDNPLQSATVIVHNNNERIPASLFVQQIAQAPQRPCGGYVVKSMNNPYGRNGGAFGPLVECYDALAGFEIVVHSHPDVFPANCDVLWQKLSKAFAGTHVGVVGADFFAQRNAYPRALQLDFFAYKPALLRSNIFGRTMITRTSTCAIFAAYSFVPLAY